MQTCTVEVRLNNDPLNTVIKTNVTPPEVLLLQAIHGPGSVIFRGERDEGKHEHDEVADYLRRQYHTIDQETEVPVFQKIFPGANYRFPIRFAEINFGAQTVENKIAPDKEGFQETEADKPKNKGGRPPKVKTEPEE